MSDILMMALMFAAALVVLYRCIVLAAHMDRGSFAGHRLRFALIALAYALIGSGAVSIALDLSGGAHMLLAGVASVFIFERRGLRK